MAGGGVSYETLLCIEMLNQVEILKMLVGLREVRDLDLLESGSVLNVSCIEADWPAVRSLASIVDEIFDGFEYESSPEFLEKIKGKSDAVQLMQRKLLDPEKRRTALNRLGESLTSILDSDEAYRLVAVEFHHSLDQIKLLVESISKKP